jgi:hypothetical protein
MIEIRVLDLFWEADWINIMAVPEKIKNIAVIILIVTHPGTMLTRKEMLNIHPMRSSRLKRKITARDIHTVIRLPGFKSLKYQLFTVNWFLLLSGIADC